MLRQLRHRLSSSFLRRPLTRYRHLGLRREDVFVASYPRSGNTWMRFMLFYLVTGRQAEFTEVDATDSPVGTVESHRETPGVLPGGGRLLKTHEPYRGEYSKAIYLARDPRDVVLSEFRFQRLANVFAGDLDRFVELFVTGRTTGYGSWEDHVESWIGGPLQDDLLVVSYEQIRREPVANLVAICEFLGLDRDAESVEAAVRANEIQRMRAREERAKRTGYWREGGEYRFVNRGEIAGWQDELPQEHLEVIETAFGDAMASLGYPRS